MAEKRVRWLIQFLEEGCLQKMLKALDPQFRTKSAAFLSDEIFTLLHIIKQEVSLINQRNVSQNKGSAVPQIDIDIYVVGLVMDLIIRKMRECDSIQQVSSVYWYAKQGSQSKSKRVDFIPNPNIFVMPSQLSEGSNKNMLVNQICTYLERYLKKNIQFAMQTPAVELLKNFIG